MKSSRLSTLFLALLVLSCSVFGQETLTNSTVLKLLKAGVSDEVLIGMISSQPGKYNLAADDIISLKQAGLSDKVLSSMLGHSTNAPAVGVGPITTPLLLHDATPVRLRLTRNLSSAEAHTGDTIDFEVLDEVKVGDVVVVDRGAKAIGTVTEAEHKRRMARGGKLDVALDHVRLADDEKVALRAVQEKRGGGHTGGMTAGIVVTALVVWPAAPFFLFMHGKDAMIPKGTEVTAYTDGEVKLDRNKFAVNTAAVK